jgi:hypothetical protein
MTSIPRTTPATSDSIENPGTAGAFCSEDGPVNKPVAFSVVTNVMVVVDKYPPCDVLHPLTVK